MLRLLRLSWLILLALAVPHSGVAQERVQLGYLFSDSNVEGTLQAYRRLLAERPDLNGRIELNLISEGSVAEVDVSRLLASDVLVFDTMNEQMLAGIETRYGIDVLATIAGHGTVLGVGESLSPPAMFMARGVVFDPVAHAYWTHAGASNQLSLMKLALSRAGIEGLDLPAPELSLDFGYYYPTPDGGQVFADWASFQAWIDARHPVTHDAPRIAVSFFKANYYSGSMAVIDAVISEIEARGARAVPIFGYPAPVAFERLLLDAQGRTLVDAAIGANFQFGDVGASEKMQAIDIAVINAINLYGRSQEEWKAAAQGLSAFEGTFNIAVPELAGTIAPTVIGSVEQVRDSQTGLKIATSAPMDERVRTAVARAYRYARLRILPNAQKRIGVLYYNYPSGRANVSASYLNVAESLHNVLKGLQAEGYDIGPHLPDSQQILDAILLRGRNVMGAAPGELADMLEGGDAQRITLDRYRQWLDALDPVLREKIIADWGAPEQSSLMMSPEDELVVPVLRFGNIAVLPQPARGWGEDLTALYHAKNLAPHHQYVATYGWLQHDYRADAVVHVGSHGTLEWLDGRDAGLGPDDASDALIADMPNAYIYNVDVVGEGLVARRRSAAVLVDHMVPPLVAGELTTALAALGEKLSEHSQNETKNPELSLLYAREARALALELGIAKDLDLPTDADWDDAQLHRVEAYILQLKSQLIPYGMHAFGRTPEADAIESTVHAVVSVDREHSLDQQAIMADEMRDRIVASGPRELASLMRLLSGRFVPAGMGGEPIRNPDAYATGKNFYGIDPDKVPKPVAWRMGVRLADEMLAAHLAQHGRYPGKVSFVIWGDETMRHEGVVEAQIFHLLGTRPVWDARGKVVGVELVPREELGRPRVDIVIASAAEGMFANVTRLMDEAVQLAKAEREADNAVRANYLHIRQTLVSRGVPEADADRIAGVRIFDEPPGQFNLNTSSIAANSGSWDSDAGMVNDYIRKMGHAYGNGFWGEAMPEVFGMAIANSDAVVHSSSTALYGALDNDDMFMYLGGLAAAVRSLSDDGHNPAMLITNTRDPDQAAMTTVNQFIGTEFRARYVNPKWIEGMKGDGYAGAGAIREFVEYLWGWDATATETVDNAMWDEVYATYVEDQYELDMAGFFEAASPYAYQDISARMLETIRKGHWQASPQARQRLVQEYLQSVQRHGVNCTEVSCGNPRLLEYVLSQAQADGLDPGGIDAVRQAFEQAMGTTIAGAAQALRDFVAVNEPDTRLALSQLRGQLDLAPSGPVAREGSIRPALPSEMPPATPPALAVAAPVLSGFVITQEQRNEASQAHNSPAPSVDLTVRYALAGLFGVMLGALALRWRRRGEKDDQRLSW